MTVDGHPATAILDTGVSYSVMSRRYAAATGERIVEHGTADAIGGAVPLAWAATRKLVLGGVTRPRSEEHTSELQSLMRISYAVFCLKKKNNEYIKINVYRNKRVYKSSR